jgi:hypothetical protein
MMRSLSATAMGLVTTGMLVAACSPSPVGSPIGPDEAVDLVLEQDDRFAGIGPRDPDLIGQAAWYEVSETEDGWEIVVRMGWGDCPAGCISEHRWTYAVSAVEDVELVSESGDPMPADSTVTGTVLAGPTCPVVTDPPDPSCADRPVEGAELIVTTQDGVEVDRVTSDADGHFSLTLAPGAYRLVPQSVEGLMGTAEPMDLAVELGMPALDLAVGYDTGIR